jgi:hypothetical protein
VESNGNVAWSRNDSHGLALRLQKRCCHINLSRFLDITSFICFLGTGGDRSMDLRCGRIRLFLRGLLLASDGLRFVASVGLFTRVDFLAPFAVLRYFAAGRFSDTSSGTLCSYGCSHRRCRSSVVSIKSSSKGGKSLGVTLASLRARGKVDC